MWTPSAGWAKSATTPCPNSQGKTTEQLTGLLDRAREVGLLTHLGGTYYTIHPALPWFLRQLLRPALRRRRPAARPPTPRCAPGSRPSASWATTTTDQFVDGNRDVIQPLALEEANLLHARRAARRHGWWGRVISAMQGLRVLYEYQGRTAEWARLVAEIVARLLHAGRRAPSPAGKTATAWSWGTASTWPETTTATSPRRPRCRKSSSPGTASRPRRPGPAGRRAPGRGRSATASARWALSVEALGHILREQGSPDCVAAYEEAIRHYQRIGDTAAEAITHFNLGHAYIETCPPSATWTPPKPPTGAAWTLRDPDDVLDRSRCIQANRHGPSRALQRSPPARRAGRRSLMQHAQAAEQHYRQALALCPPSALADLGPMHNQLGNLYKDVGQTEPAREHYERAVQYFEQTGDHYHAGQARYNLALMYLDAAERESARPAAATCCAAPRPTPRPACATSSTTRAAPPIWKPTPSGSLTTSRGSWRSRGTGRPRMPHEFTNCGS